MKKKQIEIMVNPEAMLDLVEEINKTKQLGKPWQQLTAAMNLLRAYGNECSLLWNSRGKKINGISIDGKEYLIKKRKGVKDCMEAIEREEAEMSLSGKRKRQVHPVPEELIEDLFDEKQRNGELN